MVRWRTAGTVQAIRRYNIRFIRFVKKGQDMPSTDDRSRKPTASIVKSVPLLLRWLRLLHLRVGLRAGSHAPHVHPPAATLLKQLEQAREELEKFDPHAPHAREAAAPVFDGFQLAFETLTWLDHVPLFNETAASHKIAEQSSEQAAALMSQSAPDLEEDQREALKKHIAGIQQDWLGTGRVQASQTEHIQRPPESKPERHHKPETHDPKKPQ